MPVADPVPVSKVALYYTSDLLRGSFEGAIAVFGQLTCNGSPIPQGQFVLGVGYKLKYEGAVRGVIGDEADLAHGDIQSKTGPVPGNVTFKVVYVELEEPVDANGAQIQYVLPDCSVCSFDIGPDKFTGLVSGSPEDPGSEIALRYILPELPIDPPGEGGIAFF